ncbi:hypothetical protein QBC43DRAFT_284207 [Cladorrhinum sp. PSN259]|nr:hypothetical protein QBC43DRAFT_284207 [Cladorrhinum sp. PSN259]
MESIYRCRFSVVGCGFIVTEDVFDEEKQFILTEHEIIGHASRPHAEACPVDSCGKTEYEYPLLVHMLLQHEAVIRGFDDKYLSALPPRRTCKYANEGCRFTTDILNVAEMEDHETFIHLQRHRYSQCPVCYQVQFEDTFLIHCSARHRPLYRTLLMEIQELRIKERASGEGQSQQLMSTHSAHHGTVKYSPWISIQSLWADPCNATSSSQQATPAALPSPMSQHATYSPQQMIPRAMPGSQSTVSYPVEASPLARHSVQPSFPPILQPPSPYAPSRLNPQAQGWVPPVGSSRNTLMFPSGGPPSSSSQQQPTQSLEGPSVSFRPPGSSGNTEQVPGDEQQQGMADSKDDEGKQQAEDETEEKAEDESPEETIKQKAGEGSEEKPEGTVEETTEDKAEENKDKGKEAEPSKHGEEENEDSMNVVGEQWSDSEGFSALPSSGPEEGSASDHIGGNKAGKKRGNKRKYVPLEGWEHQTSYRGIHMQ